MDEMSTGAERARGGRFDSTHWSVVLAAVRSESPEARAAMGRLCVSYWYPLYAFLRRKGLKHEDAEDLTQQFFEERVLSGKVFQGSAPGRGRFRTWLLNSLQNFLMNEWDRVRAQKRGGGAVHVNFGAPDGEERYLLEPAHEETPERIYERTWAMELLEQVMRRLQAEHAERNETALFDELKLFLPGTLVPPAYEVVAQRLGKSVAAVKMAVSRFRKSYGEALRAEIRRTVENPADVEEEWHHLVQVLGG